MSRPEIVRVWGHADDFDIEFDRGAEHIWKCSVPPDTEDGIYAVEIWARNEFGQTAYTTAELYMCDKVCHIKFNDEPFIFVFNPQITFEPSTDRYTFLIRKCKHE